MSDQIVSNEKSDILEIPKPVKNDASLVPNDSSSSSVAPMENKASLSASDDTTNNSTSAKVKSLMQLGEELAPALEFERKSKEQTLFCAKSVSDQQKDLINKILQRSNYGVEMLEKVHKYFVEKVNITKKSIKLINKLPTMHTEADPSSMNAALDYIERLSVSEVEALTQFLSNMETGVVKPLNSLHSEFHSTHKSLQSRANNLIKSLDNHYERLSKQLNQFESALSEAHENASKGSELLRDPWVEKMSCHLALKELSKVQSDGNKQLEEMFQEVERAELKRVERTQPILAEYIMLQKNASAKVAKDRDIASNTISAINFTADNNLFLQKTFASTPAVVTSSTPVPSSAGPAPTSHTASIRDSMNAKSNAPTSTPAAPPPPSNNATTTRRNSNVGPRNFSELLPQPLINTDPNRSTLTSSKGTTPENSSNVLVTSGTPFSFSVNPLTSNKSVIRSGELELDGLIRWKKYLFVLTKFGFLNYYNEKMELEKSIPLSLCSLNENPSSNSPGPVSSTNNGNNMFQLNQVATGFFSSSKTYLVRGSHTEEIAKWISDLKKFTNTTQG